MNIASDKRLFYIYVSLRDTLMLIILYMSPEVLYYIHCLLRPAVIPSFQDAL